MLKPLIATALLFSLVNTATAQVCPGPNCRAMGSHIKQDLPRGVGGAVGAAGGYVAAPPSTGGGYGAPPAAGGYGGSGYGAPAAGGGYGGGGYGTPPAGGGYDTNYNPPPPQISNYCVTGYGTCSAIQPLGTHCRCADNVGNFYDGVAQ
jgi:hypothetical protein